MTAPGPDLVRAVRAGCDAADLHFACSWPDCRCTKWPKAIRAALAKLLVPSEEMIRVGRAEIKPDALPADDGDARQCWHEMMLKVLE